MDQIKLDKDTLNNNLITKEINNNKNKNSSSNAFSENMQTKNESTKEPKNEIKII